MFTCDKPPNPPKTRRRAKAETEGQTGFFEYELKAQADERRMLVEDPFWASFGQEDKLTAATGAVDI